MISPEKTGLLYPYGDGKACAEQILRLYNDAELRRRLTENARTYAAEYGLERVVICDPGKLDDAGCKGAPDLILEVLSPSVLQHAHRDGSSGTVGGGGVVMSILQGVDQDDAGFRVYDPVFR